VNTVIQHAAYATGLALPGGFAATVQWNWREWAFGWCGEFSSLGMAGLVVGPFQLLFEWSIL